MVRKPTEPKLIGVDIDVFRASDKPTGVEIPESKKLEIFQSKGFASVTIEIRATSGKDLETKLIDTFNIHLTGEKLPTDTKILQNHMNNFIPQIGKLVEAWLKELRK